MTSSGPGRDHISNGEDDVNFGEDENHGGPGADFILGGLDSEKHFGRRGDDTIVDWKSGKHPDVFRCGAGRDEVFYNKGLDRVADDCEVLHPASKGTIQPPE
jgi:hypothetical protein